MHTWLHDDELVTWNGKVESVERGSYVVCYWGEDEEYDDGVDYVMKPLSFL